MACNWGYKKQRLRRCFFVYFIPHKVGDSTITGDVYGFKAHERAQYEPSGSLDKNV